MKQLKVAVIGASGIGKNHARWFARHGCDVVAFVGSSPASVARTQKVLKEGFGFAGRGFDSVTKMLIASRPDIVCVSTFAQMHFDHVMLSLRAGAHVLCEKPLVYNAHIKPWMLISQATQMVSEAKRHRAILGTQMQYGPALPHLLSAAGVAAEEVRDYEMLMETKNIKDARAFEQIWIDLAPHALSVLQKLAPLGKLENVSAQIGERESQATFTVSGTHGPINAKVIVRFDPEANPPQRYFSFNGRKVEYAGRKNSGGEFVSFLTAPDGAETELPDLVDMLIGDFVRACKGECEVPVSGEEGRQNVEWLLRVAEAGVRV